MSFWSGTLNTFFNILKVGKVDMQISLKNRKAWN